MQFRLCIWVLFPYGLFLAFVVFLHPPPEVSFLAPYVALLPTSYLRFFFSLSWFFIWVIAIFRFTHYPTTCITFIHKLDIHGIV